MRCPNCGFEIRKKVGDCPRCGIVFAKYNSGRRKKAKLLMTSRVPVVADDVLVKIIYPVAIAKIYVEAVYGKILGLIWDELFKGQAELNQTGNFIAFTLFCLFSYLMYHIEEYVPFIILILTGIWFLDVQLAKYRYRNCKRNDLIRLIKSPQGKVILRKTNPEGEVAYAAELDPAEVNHISIHQVDRRGGAFRETVAAVWHASVRFNDSSELLLAEEKDLLRAVKKARYAAKLLRVRFDFKHSNINETVAGLGRQNISDDTIKVKTTPKNLRISTKWTSNMRLTFFLKILKESGFFLFMLVVAGVMIKFGGLLIFLYDRFYGSGAPSVNMEFSFWGILSVFEPDWDPVDVVEYLFAMGLIVRKTLLLAQSQYVSIDSASTSYYINDTLAGECSTGEIDNVSLLTSPRPAIVVLNPNASIEVRNLKSMKEYYALFVKLREGIQKFAARPA